jgi:cytochrome c oxidase assembly factor CtaG
MDRDLRNRLRAPVRLNGASLRLTGGIALLAAAVSPPVSRAAHMFLTAHMVQHVSLLQLAPLLVVTGMRPARSGERESISLPGAMGCWAAGVAAMTLWYTPPLFAWMMDAPLHHAIVQASLVAAGGLFWWPVFSPRRSTRLRPGMAIAYLFTGCLASTLAGASIAFAGPGFFPGHVYSLLDQQVAGLIMWVPCCTVYLSAIMAILARWYGEPDADRRMAHPEA